MGLIDLKRKLQIGNKIKMVYNIYGKESLLNIPRYIVKVNTIGVLLSINKEDKKGSLLEFPKNSLLELTEKGFKIFVAGFRPLNKEEQEVLNNMPKDKEQQDKDVMYDTNVMYYREKSYLEQKGMLYLMGHKKMCGLKYDFNTQQIQDDNIKGILMIEYEFC